MDFDNPARLLVVDQPVVKVFDNASAVLLRPQVPDWIRTSSAGVWMFERLQREPMTAAALIADVATQYKLPIDAVRGPCLALLEALTSCGVLALVETGAADCQGRPAAPGAATVPRPPNLTDQSLQQLWLHITSRCNLRCEHCYYRVEHPGRDLSLDRAEQVFAEAAAAGVTQIVLSGGEPMLHPDILALAMACRRAASWQIKIVSNGTTPPVFDQVVEQIDDLQISIDGVDVATHDHVRGTGSFARAVSAFKRLHATGATVHRGISFTPLPENVDQIPALNKLGYQLAADYIHLNQPRAPGDPARRTALEARGFLDASLMRRAIVNLRRLYVTLLSDRKDARGMTYRPLHLDTSFNYSSALVHRLRHDNCGAGITTLGVDADGSVYPCAALTGRSECHLGTFPHQTLEEVRRAGFAWNRRIFSVDRDATCSQCTYRYFCGGGCRAMAAALSERDAFCTLITASYDEFFKFVSLPEKEHLERVGLTDDRAAGGYHAGARGCAEAE